MRLNFSFLNITSISSTVRFERISMQDKTMTIWTRIWRMVPGFGVGVKISNAYMGIQKIIENLGAHVRYSWGSFIAQCCQICPILKKILKSWALSCTKHPFRKSAVHALSKSICWLDLAHRPPLFNPWKSLSGIADQETKETKAENLGEVVYMGHLEI